MQCCLNDPWYNHVDPGPQYSEEDLRALPNRFAVKNDGTRFSLMKDADSMEIEYLYEDGIPMRRIWLKYPGKEVEFDKGNSPDVKASVNFLEYRHGNELISVPLGSGKCIGSTLTKVITTKELDNRLDFLARADEWNRMYGKLNPKKKEEEHTGTI